MNNNFDYSVRVKNGAAWRQFSRVRLMISVGQDYHEGDKFKAVVNWINRNPSIEEVHVSVNDYLQRHNYYAQGIDTKRADATAMAEGTLWIARNKHALSDIQAKTHITRWNEWFGSIAYQEAREAVAEYGQENPGFELAICEDVSAHTARKGQRGGNILPSWTQHSMEYLQEELAVFAMQSRQLPAAEVYPGSNLNSAEFLLGKRLPNAIAPLSQRYFTRIDFARINMRPTPAPMVQLK